MSLSKSLVLLPVAAFVYCGMALPTGAFDLTAPFRTSRLELAATIASLPYSIEIAGGENVGLTSDFAEASLLHKLRTDAPETGGELVRRAEADLERLTDAAWAAGYYAAGIRIDIAGEVLSLSSGDRVRASALAERYRATELVPIRIMVEPGPLYHFGMIRIVDLNGHDIDASIGQDRIISQLSGQPARADLLSDVASSLSANMRARGFPFARILDPEPVVDHRRHLISVVLVANKGARARISTARITRSEGIEPSVIQSHIYLDDPSWFSPLRLSEMRRSISRIEAVGSVRIREAEQLAADGTLPLEIEVTERPKRVIGGSLGFSNVDGPSGRAYWAHRNLFGGAERLRFESDLFYLANGRQGFAMRGNAFRAQNLGGRLAAGFVKPALGGTRLDAIFDAHLLRSATRSYTSRQGNALAAIRYRLGERAYLQAGVEGEFGQAVDPLGRLNYVLVGLPLLGSWDTTDSDLDAREGFRLSGNLTPYIGYGDVAPFLMAGRIQASAYRAVDDAGRFVLAGKVAVASISGGAISRIPANRRLYAGGGGSVRGYEFRSLGPKNAVGQLVGGRSVFEASVELRIRLTETIGIVPFVDIGAAFASTLPSFDSQLRIGTGIGLRYHTPIGPIRFDVATPLDRRKGEKPVTFYVSLGQAF